MIIDTSLPPVRTGRSNFRQRNLSGQSVLGVHEAKPRGAACGGRWRFTSYSQAAEIPSLLTTQRFSLVVVHLCWELVRNLGSRPFRSVLERWLAPSTHCAPGQLVEHRHTRSTILSRSCCSAAGCSMSVNRAANRGEPVLRTTGHCGERYQLTVIGGSPSKNSSYHRTGTAAGLLYEAPPISLRIYQVPGYRE